MFLGVCTCVARVCMCLYVFACCCVRVLYGFIRVCMVSYVLDCYLFRLSVFVVCLLHRVLSVLVSK